MKRQRLPESPLHDLLVVLGTMRFGTDWEMVRTAVKAALAPLDGLRRDLENATRELVGLEGMKAHPQLFGGRRRLDEYEVGERSCLFTAKK